MATSKDNLHVREKLVELLGSLTTVQVFCDMDGDPVSRLVSRVVAEDDVDGLADHLIANGVTVQEWIPVTERLPQEDGSYLVTTNYFGKHQGINIRWFAKDGETVNKYDLAGQKYVWYSYDSEYGYVSTDSVTHWMPLPTPPKGE